MASETVSSSAIDGQSLGLNHSARPTGANRNLQNACQKVVDGWFPINPELLTKIQSGFKSGAYDLDIGFLISELKTDYALYLYCTKESRKILTTQHAGAGDSSSPPPQMHPDELFQTIGIKPLREILSRPIGTISQHTFSEAESYQLKRISESMVSASAVEVLAEHRALSGRTGYTTELMRQLGITLISWNYPDSYKEALEDKDSEHTLDYKLTTLLGFSPKLLGLSLAQEWGLSADIRVALGDEGALQEAPPEYAHALEHTAETLRKLCEVGEAFARASHPDIYPSARADWETAKEALSSILGHDALRRINQRVKQNLSSYIDLAPEIFNSACELSPERVLDASLIPDGYRRNRYAKYCPEQVQVKLRSLYEEIQSNTQISRDSLNHLVKTIVPEAGFQRGCVFLLDPESMHLMPRLKIGECSLSQFRGYHALSLDTRASNPVTAAYHCNTPILESSFALTEVGSACMAAVIGTRQRIGVLYAEPRAELFIREPSLLQRFKAMVQTFEDCLRLT